MPFVSTLLLNYKLSWFSPSQLPINSPQTIHKSCLHNISGGKYTALQLSNLSCQSECMSVSCKDATAITTCDQRQRFAITVTHLHLQTHLCNLRRIIASTVTHLRVQSHVLVHAISSNCTYIQESPEGGMGHPFSLSGGLRPLITRFIPITFAFHFNPFALSLSTFTSSTSTRTSYPCCITSIRYQESPNRTVLRQLQCIQL
jgi:hypothetical protein